MIENLIYFIGLGFNHIIPEGYDHMVFVFGLFLLTPKAKPLLLQVSCFTIAHSITLFLAALKIFVPNSNYVELLISISIIFIAVENIFFYKLNPWRYAVIFIFGLVHGMAFANVFSQTSISNQSFIISIISFNIGVEIGQILLITLAYLLIAKQFANEIWYRQKIAIPMSVIIALIGLYWTVLRTIALN